MAEKLPEQDNGGLKPEAKKEAPKQPPKDYKIAEIWIKSGTVALDASPNFWLDKLRALGILDYCKDIVKDFNPQDKKRIMPAQGLGGFRNIFKKKR
jgi:hypothetical protein